uniref:SCAN box domain-containing protein n=1 Tax=Xenopus tropicalis TaxID=8364 RepID=A0A803JG49_XENTR
MYKVKLNKALTWNAIFHRYELNVETFRQRFRAYRYSNFDGPREAYPERKTGEQILEMIALEQFIEILPDKVKLWVQEHRPETSTKAISLTVEIQNATTVGELDILRDFAVKHKANVTLLMLLETMVVS